MNADRYSRRALLKALGVGAGMLPLLHSERAVAATASGFPNRFIAVTWTNGIVSKDFYPVAGDLTAALPPVLSPLEAWKSKVLALRLTSGAKSPIQAKVMLDAGQQYGGHSAYPSLLTGTYKAASPSIDQLIATSITPPGGASPLLNLGCRPGSSSTSWRGPGQKSTAETDPYRLFTKLFAGASLPTGTIDSLRARRKSVLDFVGGELTNFSNRVGTDDKVKIEAHLDSIRALEADMQAAAVPGAAPGMCAAPALPGTKPVFSQVANYYLHTQFMMSLTSAAVKCGLASVVTLDLIDDGGGNSLTFPWLNIGSPDYHAIAHSGAGAYAQKTLIDQWFYSQVALMVKDLASATEGAGTALDNTVIMVCNDMNEGANHDISNLPFLLIGSCGGFFKTGRTVALPAAVPHNQLLTSVCHAMGMTVAGVGDAKYPGDLDSVLKA